MFVNRPTLISGAGSRPVQHFQPVDIGRGPAAGQFSNRPDSGILAGRSSASRMIRVKKANQLVRARGLPARTEFRSRRSAPRLPARRGTAPEHRRDDGNFHRSDSVASAISAALSSLCSVPAAALQVQRLRESLASVLDRGGLQHRPEPRPADQRHGALPALHVTGASRLPPAASRDPRPRHARSRRSARHAAAANPGWASSRLSTCSKFSSISAGWLTSATTIAASRSGMTPPARLTRADLARLSDTAKRPAAAPGRANWPPCPLVALVPFALAAAAASVPCRRTPAPARAFPGRSGSARSRP